jgi:hypothetical protein
MERAGRDRTPSGCFPDEEASLAGRAFQHQQPAGAPMILHSVVVAGVSVELSAQWFPGVVPEDPCVSIHSAPVIVF